MSRRIENECPNCPSKPKIEYEWKLREERNGKEVSFDLKEIWKRFSKMEKEYLIINNHSLKQDISDQKIKLEEWEQERNELLELEEIMKKRYPTLMQYTWLNFLKFSKQIESDETICP